MEFPDKPADVLRRARELEADEAVRAAPALAILGSFSVDLVRPYLVVALDRLGVRLRTWFGGFGQIEQLVLPETSALWAEAPGVVAIVVRLEDVEPRLVDEAPGLEPAEIGARLARLGNRLIELAAATRRRTSAPILVANMAVSALAARGLFDASDPDGLVHLIAEANRALARGLRAVTDAHVLDYAGMVAEAGAGAWTDPKLWYMARAMGGPASQGALARVLARTVAAVVRPPAKCIVVDLDGTLWGGVLGDDGSSGIKVGDDWPGNVFKDLQARLAGYRRRGFLLAISSKNDRAAVDEALATHPELLLRREDFAAIEAGWDPKPAHLRRIARALNIGLDALVFVDDNPIERAAVRAELPEVKVVELPADPLGYASALAAVPWLDSPRLTAEDRRRGDMYAAESRREEDRSAAGSLEDFLAGLGMKAHVGLAAGPTLDRVHQLIQKTNQFNLTTRRHRRDEVEALAAGPDSVVAWLRLADRYGDMGLIWVGAARALTDGAWEVDTFLMSCRAMGRGAEDAGLAYLAEAVRARGGRRLHGVFAPTAKNTPVRSFYPDHGFSLVEERADGSIWSLDLGTDTPTWPGAIERVDEEDR